jgi:hypothetical protein
VLNLISKTPQKVIEQIGLADYQTYCGMLTTPQSGYDITAAVSVGVPWALDNGCYRPGYAPQKILAQITRWQGVPGCLFAVLPDVVGDHAATWLRSMEWLDTYHRLGYPPAFALQNGVRVQDVPYSDLAAVFIGGDDRFKYSTEVVQIVREAQQRGLWVHMGRVGGKHRLRYARDVLRIDSFDSTGFSIHPPKIKRWIPHMKVKQQHFLELLR